MTIQCKVILCLGPMLQRQKGKLLDLSHEVIQTQIWLLQTAVRPVSRSVSKIRGQACTRAGWNQCVSCLLSCHVLHRTSGWPALRQACHLRILVLQNWNMRGLKHGMHV